MAQTWNELQKILSNQQAGRALANRTDEDIIDLSDQVSALNESLSNTIRELGAIIASQQAANVTSQYRKASIEDFENLLKAQEEELKKIFANQQAAKNSTLKKLTELRSQDANGTLKLIQGNMQQEMLLKKVLDALEKLTRHVQRIEKLVKCGK